jgi:hypothetical protein
VAFAQSYDELLATVETGAPRRRTAAATKLTVGPDDPGTFGQDELTKRSSRR